jgi:NRPS condensation-like uncharacterized protein
LRAEEVLTQWRTAAFDTRQAPMVRAALQCSPAKAVICIAAHHLVVDAWSTALLMRDLEYAYRSFVHGAPPEERQTPRFSDLARQQRIALGGAQQAEKAAFWRRQLRDLPTPLRVPLARPDRPSEFRFTAGAMPFRLGTAETHELRKLCNRSGVTLFTALLTALFLTLHRMTGQTDLYVRSPVSVRNGRRAFEVVGPLSAATVVRIRSTRHLTGREWLDLVRQCAVAAQANANVAASLLNGIYPSIPDAGYGGKFQITYNHHNYPRYPASFAGIPARAVTDDYRFIKGDLVMHTWCNGAVIDGMFGYYDGVLGPAEAGVIRDELLRSMADLLS